MVETAGGGLPPFSLSPDLAWGWKHMHSGQVSTSINPFTDPLWDALHQAPPCTSISSLSAHPAVSRSLHTSSCCDVLPPRTVGRSHRNHEPKQVASYSALPFPVRYLGHHGGKLTHTMPSFCMTEFWLWECVTCEARAQESPVRLPQRPVEEAWEWPPASHLPVSYPISRSGSSWTALADSRFHPGQNHLCLSLLDIETLR